MIRTEPTPQGATCRLEDLRDHRGAHHRQSAGLSGHPKHPHQRPNEYIAICPSPDRRSPSIMHRILSRRLDRCFCFWRVFLRYRSPSPLELRPRHRDPSTVGANTSPIPMYCGVEESRSPCSEAGRAYPNRAHIGGGYEARGGVRGLYLGIRGQRRTFQLCT